VERVCKSSDWAQLKKHKEIGGVVSFRARDPEPAHRCILRPHSDWQGWLAHRPFALLLGQLLYGPGYRRGKSHPWPPEHSREHEAVSPLAPWGSIDEQFKSAIPLRPSIIGKVIGSILAITRPIYNRLDLIAAVILWLPSTWRLYFLERRGSKRRP
jgi:hypothetical protein